ncbi:glycosyl hydrolase family 18 protein [Alkalihalobacillus sp. AL-G]|uniref:glycosyl hydrolase family 18 protein n=1 Tax=Alkalihalobacillus sp. AL-G TaxID=2926399 RepID=UPI00272AD3A7|nr:glycosyl hydrolase family 18 protein [Alkalihalobacillus sp. AL-G]WLD91689.1 glycosyl hydrolase family 18 protein [Alkalihalobacillus sp. AL-G]
MKQHRGNCFSNKPFVFSIIILLLSIFTYYIGDLTTNSNSQQDLTSGKIGSQQPQVSDISVAPFASDGKTVSGTVTLSVEAEDNKGIEKVEFYSSNGDYLIGTVTSEPYSVAWATDPWVPDGEQILKVVAYDHSNQKAEVSKTVLVNNSGTSEQNDYKRIGYYAGWATYSGYQVSDIDASKLTHVNYAFANISEDGRLTVGDPWADIEKPFPGDSEAEAFKGNFNQLNKLKDQHPHLKTLISVGGWTWSDHFSDVALTEKSRTIFAESVLQFILKYDFDGVDLDWEYPVNGGEAGNINRPEDKQNFTLLLKKIRETLDAQSAKDGKKYLLTIAAGPSNSHSGNLELNSLKQYVDYIQLMTYDIHGEWDTITGMNAPLHKDPESGFYVELSVQDAVETYIANGVPADKLVMGLPFYGRVLKQVNNVNNGLYQSFEGGGSSISYAEIEANYVNKNGFTRYWEADSKVPWLFNGSTFISYDDVESIGYKTSYIKSIGLGGAMVWELSQDPNEVLLTKVYDELK